MQEPINNQSMLKVGTILRDTYRIDSYLSSGGFGNTYVATNIEFEERVAIKEFFMKGVTHRDDNQTTISVSNAENHNSFLEQKEKFKKEARRIRQLHNPGLVSVYDLFEENGTAYYVMDYIEGENLSERLKRMGRPMKEQEVNEIFLQIVYALKIVHDNGIWHLDLKPANIMIDSKRYPPLHVKIIDFGASKQMNTQNGGATTSTAISYTSGYAPREQMEQNYDKFGPWTDIYALGATFYNLLTNRRPPLPSDIDDDTTDDKHIALPFPDSVSSGMKHCILQMMNTNRNNRPQSMAEVESLFLKSESDNVCKPSNKDIEYRTNIKTEWVNDDEETIIAEPQPQIERKKPITKLGPMTEASSPTYNLTENEPFYKSNFFKVPIFLLAFCIFSIIIINYNSCRHNVSSSSTPADSLAAPMTIDTKYEIVNDKLKLNDGSTYEGEWQDGEPNGYGKYIWPNGQIFEGEWEKGIRIWGTYTWPEKRTGYMYKYVGEFNKDGEITGEGTAYYNGGDVNEGFWRNGDYLGRKKGKRMYLNTRGAGETLITGSYEWELVSVKLEDNKTILKKKVKIVDSQPSGGYFVYSTKAEFIEDAESGEKYYLNSSDIGIYPTTSPLYKARYFKEEYPSLPSSVESININSGNSYYIKNLKIK